MDQGRNDIGTFSVRPNKKWARSTDTPFLPVVFQFTNTSIAAPPVARLSSKVNNISEIYLRQVNVNGLNVSATVKTPVGLQLTVDGNKCTTCKSNNQSWTESFFPLTLIATDDVLYHEPIMLRQYKNYDGYLNQMTCEIVDVNGNPLTFTTLTLFFEVYSLNWQ